MALEGTGMGKGRAAGRCAYPLPAGTRNACGLTPQPLGQVRRDQAEMRFSMAQPRFPALRLPLHNKADIAGGRGLAACSDNRAVMAKGLKTAALISRVTEGK